MGLERRWLLPVTVVTVVVVAGTARFFWRAADPLRIAVEDASDGRAGLADSPVNVLLPAATPPRADPPLRQGEFAAALASRLGLGGDLSEDRAIAVLTSKGIAPDSGWVKGAPPTEDVVAEIQKSLHVLLTEVAGDLSVRVPATLNVFIFEAPRRAGQSLHVSAKDMAALRANGGTIGIESLKMAVTERISIEAPQPLPVGDDQLPTVWSHRLRHPGASFVRIHFEKIDLSAPSYVQVLDRYGLEIWRDAGGEPNHADIWATAVAGDTATIALHSGAVSAGTGLIVDKYDYGPAPRPAK